MKYSLYTREARVDLRSFPSIRAYFNELSFEEVSRDPSLITFFFMFTRVLLLTLCVVTGYMEPLGKCSSYYKP